MPALTNCSLETNVVCARRIVAVKQSRIFYWNLNSVSLIAFANCLETYKCGLIRAYFIYIKKRNFVVNIILFICEYFLSTSVHIWPQFLLNLNDFMSVLFHLQISWFYGNSLCINDAKNVWVELWLLLLSFKRSLVCFSIYRSQWKTAKPHNNAFIRK